MKTTFKTNQMWNFKQKRSISANGLFFELGSDSIHEVLVSLHSFIYSLPFSLDVLQGAVWSQINVRSCWGGTWGCNSGHMASFMDDILPLEMVPKDNPLFERVIHLGIVQVSFKGT